MRFLQFLEVQMNFCEFKRKQKSKKEITATRLKPAQGLAALALASDKKGPRLAHANDEAAHEPRAITALTDGLPLTDARCGLHRKHR
jgi:hypothetical protein